MSELEVTKRPSVFKRKDVRLTGILWVFFSVVIGYVAGLVQSRAMGAPASSNMSTTINMIKIFTWVSAPIAGLVAALAVTTLLEKVHFGDAPPAEADHQIRNSPRIAAAWIVVSSLLCLFAVVWGMIVLQKDDAAILNAQAMNINVVGQQWVWNYDYVDSGKVRSSDLYLPVNKPVVFPCNQPRRHSLVLDCTNGYQDRCNSRVCDGNFCYSQQNRRIRRSMR
jgi:cytochrome c oxidase subunit 2